MRTIADAKPLPTGAPIATRLGNARLLVVVAAAALAAGIVLTVQPFSGESPAVTPQPVPQTVASEISAGLAGVTAKPSQAVSGLSEDELRFLRALRR
jgi:membrane associated rhomboid family serine protease